MTLSEIFEGLTAIGLFISVALVFIELRRNATLTRLNNSILFTERHFLLRAQTYDQELATIIVKGRTGLKNLSEPEQLAFSNYLLNTAQTASLRTIRNNRGVLDSDTAEKHSLRIMELEWNNQGGREYWDKIKNSPPLVPHVKALVEKAMN